MKPYKINAEDDDVRVDITFKKVPAADAAGTAKTGNAVVGKPMLGVAHFLRALLTFRGGKHYPDACKELAAFFERMTKKYLGI